MGKTESSGGKWKHPNLSPCFTVDKLLAEIIISKYSKVNKVIGEKKRNHGSKFLKEIKPNGIFFSQLLFALYP